MAYAYDIPFHVDLTGRVALITGGNGGIGGMFCRALAACGAQVIVLGRNEARCRAVADEIIAGGGLADVIAADVTDEAAMIRVRDTIRGKYGKLNILINAAGINRRYWLEDFPTKDWDEVMNINVNGAVYCTQLVGKYMLAQGYGKVINLASMNSFVSGKRVGAYVASKGAIAQITKAFANEWGDRGVRVNAIAPGYIRTDMTKALQDDPASYQGILDRIPEGRWGTPDDLVGPVLLLVSDAADYVNGIVMPIDGGYLAR